MVEDLRSFLKQVEASTPEDLRRISKEIDPRFEIAALVAKLEQQRRTPVLVFEKVKGSKFPTVVNVHASRKRIAMGMKTTPEDMRETYFKAVQNPIPPRRVSSGPVQEVVHEGGEVNLLNLPQTIFHEGEGSAYITAGVVTTRDPETGVRNSSYNRLMIRGKNRLTLYMTAGKHLWECYKKAEAKKEALPVSIHIGSHPAWSVAVLFSSSYAMDELGIAGALLGEPLDMVQCLTVDADVPAHAEIALEGEMPPYTRDEEGPFAEFTGFSVGKALREVVEIKAITHREDALFQTIVSGPHYEHLVMGTIPMEVNLLEKVRGQVPSVKDVHMPTAMTVFVSIKKRAEGQGKSALLAALGGEFYSKHVVVVDEDVDVRDPRQVWWAVATRARADRDIVFIPGVRGSGLDPTASEEGVITKMGIDATAKPSMEAYPPKCKIPAEAMQRVRVEDYVPVG